MKYEELSQTVEILVPKDLVASVEGSLKASAGLQIEKAPPSRDVSMGVEILAITAHSIVIIAELLRLKEHFSNRAPVPEAVVVRNVEGSKLNLNDASEQTLKDLMSGESD